VTRLKSLKDQRFGRRRGEAFEVVENKSGEI
jgi:hypothetical protein